MPEILFRRPPNFEAIHKVFPMADGLGVIFAYAPYIFVPSGNSLPPELIAHEQVHIDRQTAMGVDAWWQRYLVDVEFRYLEELLAHRAEYQKLCELEPVRQRRRANLTHVAKSEPDARCEEAGGAAVREDDQC